MEVILIKEVNNLGDPGNIVTVKNGYARNYLIPNKYAVEKTPTSLKILEKQKEEFAKIVAAKNEQYTEIIDKLKEISELNIEVRAGEDGKLFGKITNQNIADAINQQHQIMVDKKQIIVKEQIKLLGSYVAHINLNKDFKIDLPFNVVKSA